MRERLALALWLGVAAASGCAHTPDRTVSLAAERSPATTAWTRLFGKPAATHSEHHDDAPSVFNNVPAEGSSPAALHAGFLDQLDPETKALVDAELKKADSEEARVRLMTYLSTVSPERIPAILKSRQKAAAADEAAEAQPLSDAEWAAQPQSVETPKIPAAREVAQSDETARPFPTSPSPPLTASPPSAGGPSVEQTAAIDSATVTVDAAAGSSAFSRFKQWDPRKTLGLSWNDEPTEEPVPQAVSPAASEGLFSPLAKIKGLRPRNEPTPEGAHDAPVPASPVPTTASSRTDLDATYVEEELHRLVSLMEAKAGRLEPGSTFADREKYIRQHALLRMLYLMENEPQLALQAIPGVDGSTQEFWTAMMWGFSAYFDSETTPDPTDRAALALQQFRIAAQHLQPVARLETRNLTFCERIDGFGVYQPFDRAVFRSGQAVLLYAEVRNFKTELSNNQYRTVLRSTIEILRNGPEGELVERRQFDPTIDLSRSPRNDYFHSYKLDLPGHLTPGPHTVRLTLEDDLSGKITSSTVDFLVR